MTSRAAVQRRAMLADLRRDTWAGVTIPPRGYYAPCVPTYREPYPPSLAEVEEAMQGSMPVRDLPPTPLRLVTAITPVVEVTAVTAPDDLDFSDEYRAEWDRALACRLADEAARTAFDAGEKARLQARIADLENQLACKVAGETELDSSRRYLAAYLTLETPEDPAALLAEVAKPWHERGRLWIHVVNTVKNAGIEVGKLPMELSKRKGQ